MIELKIKELQDLMKWKIRDLEDAIITKEWERVVILAADIKEVAGTLEHLEDLVSRGWK